MSATATAGATHARLHPTWAALDVVTGVAYAVPAAMVLLNEASGSLGDLFALVGTAMIVFALARRRQNPTTALALLLAPAASALVLEPRTVSVFLLPLAWVLFSVATTWPTLRALSALGLAIAVAIATVLPDPHRPGAAMVFVPLYVVAWTIGYAVALHLRDLRHQLTNVRRLARAEHDRIELDLVHERMRVARELHDVVAHGISLITVQAGFGGLVLDQSPEVARSALGTIESTGRQTLAELRLLLTTLREEHDQTSGPPLSPMPRIEDIDSLAAGMAAAGLTVRVTTSGEPWTLTPALQLTAYRIVQEALTNVARHAGASHATVCLEHDERHLRVVVRDLGTGRQSADGQGPGGTAPPGHGIRGMRERAALHGGALTAGPCPTGGFEVRCELPVHS